MKDFCLIVLLFIGMVSPSAAQRDSVVVVPMDSVMRTTNPAFTKDTGIHIIKGDTVLAIPHHSPSKAALRSALIPGWGQAYNREYWKIPIVYGILGTSAGFFVYNHVWYKRTRNAYRIRVNNDTASFGSIHPTIRPLSPASLVIYRNAFRRDRDYATLYFILLWGLNVVDATVFAHLKEFDVSEDLSLRIHPHLNVQGSKGISLVLSANNSPKKHNFLLP